MAGFLFLMQEMQYVDQNGKAEQKDDTAQVDNRFHFPIKRFFANPLNQAKDDFRAVERGYRQQIEHGEVDADKRGDIQKPITTARRLFRGDFNRRNRSAHSVDTQLARYKLAKRTKYRSADFERIDERMPDRGEKPVFVLHGIQSVYAHRFQERVGIGGIFTIGIRR